MAKMNIVGGVAGILMSVAVIHGQTVGITGTLIDSVTLQPQANAVVSLVEDPAIRDTTDCYGNFTLGGTTGAHTAPADVQPATRIDFRGNTLSIVNGNHSDATVVTVFNAAGQQVYQAVKPAQEGATLTFERLWKVPGLYTVRIRTAQREQHFICLADETQSIAVVSKQNGLSGSLSKTAAPFTVAFTKPGYASKQVVASSATTALGQIKFRAVLPTLPVTPMTIISHFCPLFVSGGQAYSSGANDTNTTSLFYCDKDTGWLAYDLSSKPVAARQMVLLAWYDAQIGYFAPGGTGEPKDYTIEINRAAGGACPVTGWVTVLSVTGNYRSSRYHEIHLAGANWIRMRVSASYTTQVTWDMDIYDVTNGFNDSWIHMGDSNTGMYLGRWGTAFPNAIRALKNNAWPCWEGAGIGGTGSYDGLKRLDSMLITFPGKFICVNHGTNDGPDSSYYYRMDTIVTKVLAAGRVPVIPTVPWRGGNDMVDSGTVVKNKYLQSLYTKYPQILKGPDLWTLSFQNSTVMGGLHWTNVGSDSLRANWIRKVASTLK